MPNSTTDKLRIAYLLLGLPCTIERRVKDHFDDACKYASKEAFSALQAIALTPNHKDFSEAYNVLAEMAQGRHTPLLANKFFRSDVYEKGISMELQALRALGAIAGTIDHPKQHDAYSCLIAVSNDRGRAHSVRSESAQILRDRGLGGQQRNSHRQAPGFGGQAN